MSTSENHLENEKKSNPLPGIQTPEDFQHYIDRYGIERALGYRDAMQEMLKDLFQINDDVWTPLSDQVAGRKAKKFRLTKTELLKNISGIVDSNFTANQKTTDTNLAP